MTSTSDTIVEFRSVTYLLPTNSKPIISDLNLTVLSGETLVLLGESGCGKTTTLKLVNVSTHQPQGRLVEGRTADWEPIRLRRRTGYVIQEGGLFPHFTVEQNVALVPHLRNWDEARVKERVNELLSLVGTELQGVCPACYPRELSGGQRQRVGVARALAAEPHLLSAWMSRLALSIR